MDNEDVVHITMEYYSAIKRNKTGSFVKMWMDLETVIQSEVSQKEKNKIMYAIFCTCLEKGNKFDLHDHENVFDVDFEGLLGFS